MTWERPVPLVGDVTAASQRAADPTGWAFDESARAAFYSVVDARRDVRRFRPDAVPDDVLHRVLGAAHVAPSVGHSQPWRFIVVRDPAVRTRAATLADRERLRQAGDLAPDAARRLLDLKLEGIREAPVGIVVCCDRRTPAAGVLGRATFSDADVWSCAAAIQNLWLAARAEGLGLGWVTLFQPSDLASLVGLPDGVVTLGWLCLGWPDERPPAPGLQRAGWSKRLPLEDVVFSDRWPSGDRVAAPASHLRAPTSAAVVAAHDDADRLLTPPGSLGVLDRAVERILAVRGDVNGGTLVLAAADHPVTALGVSAYAPEVTAQVFAAAEVGEALGVTAASSAGLDVVLVDAGVDSTALAEARSAATLRGDCDGARNDGDGARNHGIETPTVAADDPRGDLAASDAMSLADAQRFVAAGRGIGKRAANRGLVALGEIGIGNTTVSSCLAAALTGMDVADAVGLGAGADSAILDNKRAVVTAALARWRDSCAETTLHGHGSHDTHDDAACARREPMRTLAVLGGPEIAVLTGVILGATEADTVTVLDGLATGVAALLAMSIEPAVAEHLVAGQRSRERAHARVLLDLGCEPLLDLRIRAGEGVGASLATNLLLQTLAMRRATARVAY
ncbi:MAG TPA: 5,6-dimethylbenzimidazole synthase [Micromonosporaceae bacterium]|jgi:nicotinate-nucleotide--dimethylbenzimidazole phosphoribosyltransferase|nr:5,6-dimethylbenzimidazole synthase [Micromonosporaceae bacterium]